MACFFDACVSNTREGLDYLRSTLDVPEGKLGCNPYEVPDINLLNSFNSGADKCSSLARPVFLYVGQLIGRKGLPNFLHACSLLKEQGKTDYSAVIVGKGAEGETLHELVKSLGLEDQVHWMGKVDYEKLGTYYRACDVFVFPTLEDTWGLVVLEAMAFGKAILCSKYAGSKELIVEGENGYIFDPREPRELAELMARFVSEPGLAGELGAKSKQIIDAYTPRQAASILASTVSTVLAQGNQSSHDWPGH
jgi:glycosyltransferase involved in cell wall biosynthesis